MMVWLLIEELFMYPWGAWEALRGYNESYFNWIEEGVETYFPTPIISWPIYFNDIKRTEELGLVYDF